LIEYAEIAKAAREAQESDFTDTNGSELAHAGAAATACG
jgi:hypothetical protein